MQTGPSSISTRALSGACRDTLLRLQSGGSTHAQMSKHAFQQQGRKRGVRNSYHGGAQRNSHLCMNLTTPIPRPQMRDVARVVVHMWEQRYKSRPQDSKKFSPSSFNALPALTPLQTRFAAKWVTDGSAAVLANQHDAQPNDRRRGANSQDSALSLASTAAMMKGSSKSNSCGTGSSFDLKPCTHAIGDQLNLVEQMMVLLPLAPPLCPPVLFSSRMGEPSVAAAIHPGAAGAGKLLTPSAAAVCDQGERDRARPPRGSLGIG